MVAITRAYIYFLMFASSHILPFVGVLMLTRAKCQSKTVFRKHFNSLGSFKKKRGKKEVKVLLKMKGLLNWPRLTNNKAKDPSEIYFERNEENKIRCEWKYKGAVETRIQKFDNRMRFSYLKRKFSRSYFLFIISPSLYVSIIR